jgi:nitrogen regulatory protein PII
MKLVLLITAKTELGLEVAEAWQEAGAPGVTILNAHGLHGLQKIVKEGDFELPRMVVSMGAAMAHIMNDVEFSTVILISIMPPEVVEAVIEKTTATLGDLTKPNTGVVFVLDVERAIGVVPHTEQHK